jgi:CRP-like cAMP-binding protein
VHWRLVILVTYLSGLTFLLFPVNRSTVRCVSDTCRIHEMRGEDFLEVANSSPRMATALRNMCRKKLLKKAVKQFSLQNNRGFNDADIVAAFHDADLNKSGSLNEEELGVLMHRMDPGFPMSEIHLLMKFVDVDEDGQVGLDEFKQIFRQFEDEKSKSWESAKK